MAPRIAPGPAGDIGHAHQLRDHAHQIAAAAATEHGGEIAAAAVALPHRSPIAWIGGKTTTIAVLHHPAHHRAHVCIIRPNRRWPIFAFIMSSSGANSVTTSPPPKLPNRAAAGAVVIMNNRSTTAA